jgi:DNA repair protein RadA/Sms
MEVASAKDMEARFRDSVRSGFGGAVLDINDIYNIGQPFKIYPGAYITIMGDTGLGKTAFIQNLMVKWRLPSLLFSLENSEQLMYRRFVQIKHGMTKEEVFEYYKYNDNHLSDDLSHVRIVTVKPLIQSIKDLLPTSGAKLVVIDTIDCIEVPFKNDMDKLRVIPTELSFMAQQYGLIIIGVSHISKQASRGGAMDVHSTAGPATIEQRSDKVISIEGDRAHSYRIIKSQKARDETPFHLAAIHDCTTFRFDQVTF